MRYSSINHWYKIEEVLGGLEGTSSAEVQVQLLKHLSAGHMSKMVLKDSSLEVEDSEGSRSTWGFRSSEAADHFVEVIREWFKSQGVSVPPVQKAR